MKGLLKFIGTLGLLYGVSSGMAARAQKPGRVKIRPRCAPYPLWGHVKDGFTYAALHGSVRHIDARRQHCGGHHARAMFQSRYTAGRTPITSSMYRPAGALHHQSRASRLLSGIRGLHGALHVARNPYVDARHHEMRRRPYASFADRSLGEVVVKATKIGWLTGAIWWSTMQMPSTCPKGRCSMNWSASCPERN